MNFRNCTDISRRLPKQGIDSRYETLNKSIETYSVIVLVVIVAVKIIFVLTEFLR